MSDLISRQKMLNRLEEWNTDDPTDKALYNFAWNRIIEQPTIELRCEECEAFNKTRLLIPQPERKRGKWIAHPGGKFVGFPYMHYECDQCRDFEPKERNFCPNCGGYTEKRPYFVKPSSAWLRHRGSWTSQTWRRSER